MAKLDEDRCTITHDEGTDYFIRAVLEVPIHGIEEPFLWGVWVSLSRKSFERYLDTFNDPVDGEGFFGWLCNAPSYYPTSGSRPADVWVHPGHHRPKVVLRRGGQETDPWVIDQVNGISVQRAQAIAERSLHEA